MFKKILLFSVMGAAALSVSAPAWSQCNGQILGSDHMNAKGLVWSSCKQYGGDYRVQGLAYNDMRGTSGKNSDRVDAVSAVCRSISKGNIMLPSDFQAQPIVMQCDKSEVFAGAICDDHGGEDSLDGCTILCQKPGSTNLRQVGNNGDTGGRGERMSVMLPQRIVAVGYSDKKDSDVADGVALCAASN